MSTLTRGRLRDKARPVTTSIQSLIASARRSGDWKPVLDAVPYFRFLGVGLRERDGRLEAHMAFSDHLVGNPTIPALHGGTLGALLEAVAQCEVLYRAESVVLPKTITLTIDYLRSGKPVGTTATATVLKHGRRVATVQARAFQDDPNAPIAVATVHLLVRAD
ncbi:MAG: PaaI family thioesterase [Myxococcaceae bacterium]|nr:PaaI family thioesterase [Myxococcaceae bacterium]